MGYISIQINKAKGSADTGASDHIERKTMPKNADPTRTHLNRELVEFPDGVADRTEAISHRIRTAGIRRKIPPRPSAGNPHCAFGHARGHDKSTGRRQTGRIV